MSQKNNSLSWKETFTLTRRAIHIWWKNAPQTFLSTACSTLVTAASPYVTIYFSALLINEIAGSRDPGTLWRLTVTVLLTTALLGLLGAGLKRWKNAVHAMVWDYLLKIQSDKLLSLDFCDADSPKVYDLDSQIRQDNQFNGWGLFKIQRQFEDACKGAVQIIGAVALSVSLFTLPVPEGSGLSVLNHPLFLVLFLVLMLAITLLSPAFATKAQSYWNRINEDGKLGNRIFSFFGFMALTKRKLGTDIRIYRQDILCDYKMSQHHLFDEKSQVVKYAKGPMGGYAALSAAVSRCFTGIVYLFVCLKAWGGAFGVGSVTQYISAVTSLSEGVSTVLKTAGDMRANGPYLQTLFKLLDMPNKMYQGSLSVEKRNDRKYEVEFKNVSFQYPSSDSYALRNVSFKFKIGERLAVVGQNGSGKTTMIKLLCRLYDPTEGQILLNGIDIRKYNYKEYMSVFSVVFQDFQLFAFPLGQNVAGSTQVDRKRAEACLRDVGFGDRLDRMPEGLDTYLYKDFSKTGVEVSGGEAQKIAIARALYKDAPFIVLDEPTAALDPVAETEVYESFDKLIQDKTAIYISHRLSSCRFCDKIAVFDEGRIVQVGNHDSLIADEDGKYYELWVAQAQYYT